MNNRFAITFAIGIGLVAVAVAGVLLMQRGARIGLAGSVLKVRTAAMDENSSVAVIDFRFANPGNVAFWVRTVDLVMEDKDGKQYEGKVISEGDAARLFEAVPLLGQKFTETLTLKDKIPGHTSQDRMVAARFEAPEARLEGRKRFLVRIEEIDGQTTELSEK